LQQLLSQFLFVERRVLITPILEETANICDWARITVTGPLLMRVLVLSGPAASARGLATGV
jgi:hypothetical protein